MRSAFEVPMRAAPAFGTVAAAAATLISSALLTAQAPPAPPQPVFRAGVELVSVDVTALDTNGRQVTDLAAADYDVRLRLGLRTSRCSRSKARAT